METGASETALGVRRSALDQLPSALTSTRNREPTNPMNPMNLMNLMNLMNPNTSDLCL
jgi:hypothetical protein